MVHRSSLAYPLDMENLHCAHPCDCYYVEVLIIGSAIGLASVPYLMEQWRRAGKEPLRVAIADAGPFDLPTHWAHVEDIPRAALLKTGGSHFGGKLVFWGMSTPRPPDARLKLWPYDWADLQRRFASVEDQLGVKDAIPLSGGDLEKALLGELQYRFPAHPVRVAPLAINRDGKRWCPLKYVQGLARQGVRMLPRFQCMHLVRKNGRIAAVRGKWHDGRSYTIRPKVVVLAVGVEPSLPLIRQVVDQPIALEATDHIRIDLHGRLPAEVCGRHKIEQLGVAVLLMECAAKESGVPYHLEIKVAPKGLWARGFMQSSDNLRGDDADDTLYVQVQAVAAMHDRLPSSDLLQVDAALPPVMSARDASFHGQIIEAMRGVAGVIGLTTPAFSLRPLLTNHHIYGAYRVGKAVSKEFRFQGLDNLYVLPPSAYVDLDDDANPTLKSLVLAQYAMDEIIANLRCNSGKNRVFTYSI